MRYRGYRNSMAGGISGGIVLIGLALAFAFGDGFNLPVFFIALAVASLVGSIGTMNPRGLYGGLYGFCWLLMLALFFITGSWIWFLVGAGLSAILSAFARPLMAGILGMSIFGMANQQPPQYYQPPQQQPYQPYQTPQQQPTYGQGYQPAPQPETYQEGEQQYPYPQTPNPQQYEQPQAQYPQQLPPQS